MDIEILDFHVPKRIFALFSTEKSILQWLWLRVAGIARMHEHVCVATSWSQCKNGMQERNARNMGASGTVAMATCNAECVVPSRVELCSGVGNISDSVRFFLIVPSQCAGSKGTVLDYGRWGVALASRFQMYVRCAGPSRLRWMPCCRVCGWCLGGTGCRVMCVWCPVLI